MAKFKNRKKKKGASSVNGNASNAITTANKKTKRADLNIGNVRSLNDLPTEILGQILSFLDLGEIGQCLRLNNRFYKILRPIYSNANHIYREFRKRLGLPDPAVFSMNETTYIRTIFGPSICGECCQIITHWSHEKPIWEFGGEFFCSSCFWDNTVSESDLRDDLDKRQYRHLPSYCSIRNFYLKREVIYDRIPDDKEVEEMSRQKEEIEKASSIIYDDFRIPTIWINYNAQKFKKYKKSVYKWLMYKYPCLDEEFLESLSELDDEMEARTSLDTLCGRERLESVTLKGAREHIEQLVYCQMERALEIRNVTRDDDVRVADQIEQWKSYNPFWKNALVAKDLVPMADDIVEAMERHQEGFAKYVKDMGKRIEMMIKHAHDLKYEHIVQLMETDAYKDLNEDEFIEQCDAICDAGGTRYAPLRYHCGSVDVKLSCLRKEMMSHRLYKSNNRVAYANFVKRILTKQNKYRKSAREHIRRICANDDAFEMTIAMTEPENNYSKFLELRINSSGVVDEHVNIDYDDDNDFNSYYYAKTAKIFSCRKCGKKHFGYGEHALFDEVLSHVLDHEEKDVEDIVIDDKWLSSVTQVANWYSELSKTTSSWSIEEKLMAKHLFWKDGDSAIHFAKFRNHVKRCHEWFSTDRKDYQDALAILTDDGFLDNSNDVLGRKTDALFEFGKTRDLIALKFDFVYAKTRIEMDEVVYSFSAQRMLGGFMLGEFRRRAKELEDDNEALETVEEIEDAMLDIVDEIEEKWKVVDELCAEFKREFRAYHSLEALFKGLCVAAMDMDSINVKPWLRSLQKVKKIVNEFVPRIKEELVRQFGVSLEVFQEYDDVGIFLLKLNRGWWRCSLKDYIGKMIERELGISKYDEVVLCVIGEFTAFRHDLKKKSYIR